MPAHPLSHIKTRARGPVRTIVCPECGREISIPRRGRNAHGVISRLRGMLAAHIEEKHPPKDDSLYNIPQHQIHPDWLT